MFLLIRDIRSVYDTHVYFNTSHVSINQIREKQDPEEVNFNTSHVSINRLNTGNLETAYKYFNTSHVSINLNHV